MHQYSLIILMLTTRWLIRSVRTIRTEITLLGDIDALASGSADEFFFCTVVHRKCHGNGCPWRSCWINWQIPLRSKWLQLSLMSFANTLFFHIWGMALSMESKPNEKRFNLEKRRLSGWHSNSWAGVGVCSLQDLMHLSYRRIGFFCWTVSDTPWL